MNESFFVSLYRRFLEPESSRIARIERRRRAVEAYVKDRCDFAAGFYLTEPMAMYPEISQPLLPSRHSQVGGQLQSDQ